MLLTATMLLTGCSNNDEPTGDDDLVALTIDVAESGWADESFSVSTRSGETIDGLKAVADIDNPADGEGFCLHAVNLLGATTVRRQVVWNATTGQWNSGQLIYWQRTSADDYFRVYAYAPYKNSPYGYTEVSIGDIDAQNATITFADADVAEFIAGEGSLITQGLVKDQYLPSGVTLGGLVRDGVGYPIYGNTQIMAGDSVVVFSKSTLIKKLDRYFCKPTSAINRIISSLTH